MAQPVWILSVDLQAKTATFQTGLADAARSARSAFRDIGDGAGDMGHRVSKGSLDIRHALGLVDNTIRGAHSMAMVDMIRMFQNSALVMTALPFAMTVAGFALVAEIVAKGVEEYKALRIEAEKLRDAQTLLGTSVNDAFSSLDQKLIQAQKQADELSNNHLDAVRKELELIDKESLDTLRKTFGDLDKQADGFFKHLTNAWYQFGGDAAGAAHALDQFKLQYDALLSSGKTDAASGLLKGTLEQARTILQLQEKFAKQFSSDDFLDVAANRGLLEKAGGSGDYDTKTIDAQRALVQVLQAQADAEAKVQAIKTQTSHNVVKQNDNQDSARRSAAARQEAETMARMGEQALTADKAVADARLAMSNASLETRLASERERGIQAATNQAQIAALDKSGKDYQNQLKGLQEKQLEIQSSFDAKTAEAKARVSVEVYQRDLTNLQQSEREKIEATQQGSEERLAAIDAALKEEESRNLEATAFFRELLTQRVQAARQAAQAEGKDKEDAAREEASNAEKMGMMGLAAEKQRVATADSLRRVTIDKQIAEATQFADEEYRIKTAALEKQEAGLDKSGKDYVKKLQEIQDKEKQLTQQHENDITDIKEKAEQERNQRIQAAEGTLFNSMSASLTQSIMGHQTWAKMLATFGDEAVSGMIKNSILILLQQDKQRLGDARTAGSNAYTAVSGIPIVGPALAPVAGAAAFAAVMAFEGGTDRVPGIGRGDVVPSMLSPGEGVVPGGVMDGLRNVARNGGFESRGPVTVHVRPTYIVNTIDGDGMRDTLEKHSDQLQRHLESTIRRLNR
jgi:hypothetical protein